jgi:hypothetical protein
MRFGAMWLVVTMLPYVWFTAGNVSRYIYLPSVGFGWAIAGATVAGCDLFVGRYRLRREYGQVAFLLVAAFIAVRFGRFDAAAIRGQVRSLDGWRFYVARLHADARSVDGVIYTAVPDPNVLPIYLEPMLRWERQDNELRVVVVGH